MIQVIINFDFGFSIRMASTPAGAATTCRLRMGEPAGDHAPAALRGPGALQQPIWQRQWRSESVYE